MEVRKFSNLIFMLFGGFIIYSQVFKYTLGALFSINESEIINEYFFSFSLHWGAICGSTLCFVIFIKNADFLTYCLYRRNYLFDLNVQNQYTILNVVFLTFSISALISKFIGYRNLDVWDKVFSSSTILSLFIILTHRVIIKFMIQKINLYSEEQSKYCFIFSMLTLLFNFFFFRIYNLDYNPSTLYDFACHFIILFVSVCSPIIFNSLIKKGVTITNAQFTYILFFWIIFLYNIQYNFFMQHFNYDSNNGETAFVIKYISFHILLPLCLLYFHKLSLKIKTLSIFQFLFIVSGTLFVFCGIITNLKGASQSSYPYLIFGLLFFFLTQKTGFMDTQLARIKFKVLKRNLEPSMVNNSSFIIITLLIVLLSTNIFTSYSKFNLDYSLYIGSIVFEFVIIGKLALSKKMRLSSLNDFIALIVISISIIILSTNNLTGKLISKLFNRHFVQPIQAIDIVMVITLLCIILFSSQIAKMIKAILSKNYSEFLNMKKFNKQRSLFFAFLFICFLAIAVKYISKTNTKYTAIPDANFEQALIDIGIDSGSIDGEVETANIVRVTDLNVSNKNIEDLTGIQDFIALIKLNCYSNRLITLDLNKNTALKELYCYWNQLTVLNVNNNKNLMRLQVYSNKLSSLDISKNLALTQLLCEGNKLTSLDLSKNTNLTEIYFGENPLTNIDVTKNKALTKMYFYNSQLTAFDVTQNEALTELVCERNHLTTLDVTQNKVLTKLVCGMNQLTVLDVANNTALTQLNCVRTLLKDLDLTKNTGLTKLDCSYNQLTVLDIKRNTGLTELNCSNNPLKILDVTKNTLLTTLKCSDDKLTTLDIRKNTALTTLECSHNSLSTLNLTNNTNLANLACGNNQLTELGLTSNTSLADLACENNQLTELDVTQNIVLTKLNCSSNKLTALNIQNGNNISIYKFDATENPGLKCIQADFKAPKSIMWYKDHNTNYSTRACE